MSAVVLKMPQKSPQLEDGHVRIANELYDALLAFPLSGKQYKVAMAVVRKTYGYGKKEDDLSASQLGALLGKMARPHITTALNELAALGVIHKRPGKYGCILGINKDYSRWGASTESVHPSSTKSVQVSQIGTCTKTVQVYGNGVVASTDSVQVDSTKTVHTKDNLPKDNQQNKDESAGADSSDDLNSPSANPEDQNQTPNPIALLPLVDGSEFGAEPQQVAEWSAAFPAVDAHGEFSRMRVWLNANLPKRPTRRGIARFIVSWLGRAQKDATNPQAFRTSRAAKTTGAPIHGNFAKQDYHAGVGDDGRF